MKFDPVSIARAQFCRLGYALYNKIAGIAAVVAFAPSSLMAAEHHISCSNPRQEYVAIFDDVAQTFIVSAPGLEVAYQVSSVEKIQKHFIISGITVTGGPGFIANTGERKSIAFLENGTVVQTDHCK